MSTLFYQLLKLTLGCGISFSAGALKIAKNALDAGQYFFLLTCIIIHFPVVSKKYAIFFNTQLFWPKVN